MEIVNRPSPNRAVGRQNQLPDFIVCHITGGSFTSAINTITNPASQVSYHFVVSRDGTVVQAVNIRDTAWANGTTINGDNRDNKHSTIPVIRSRRRNANQYTVSIGFADSSAGELSAAQLAAGVNLVLHIRSQVKEIYGLEIPMEKSNVIGHHEITPITRPFCPGPRFPFGELLQRVNEKLSQPQNPISQPQQNIPLQQVQTPNSAPSSWAIEAWSWGKGLGLTDGTNPQGIPTREQMITLLHRYHLLKATG
ncbi:MAG: peptidoglycan recognition protein family protein [Defluviitaleaceae bacterium]|nr:peptidoglycan recognition protein family protein [Defluviitaleaceae bacterium]